MAGAYVAKPGLPPGWDPSWPYPPYLGPPITLPPASETPDPEDPGSPSYPPSYSYPPTYTIPPILPLPTQPGLPWSPIWPFPGPIPSPWPPSYYPTYSFTMTAPTSTTDGQALSATAILYNAVTFPTAEPDQPMLWWATVGGELRNIRFNGDDDYSSFLMLAYSTTTGFWGGTLSLDVELLEGDGPGDDIVLTVASVVRGYEVWKTITIQILIISVSMTISATITDIQYPDSAWSARADIDIDEIVSSTTQRGEARFRGGKAGEEWTSTTVRQGTGPTLPVAVANSSLMVGNVTIDVLAGEDFDIRVFLYSPFCAAIFDIELTVSIFGGGVIETITRQHMLDFDDGDYTWGTAQWLTINGITGETTIINDF